MYSFITFSQSDHTCVTNTQIKKQSITHNINPPGNSPLKVNHYPNFYHDRFVFPIFKLGKNYV